MGLIKKISESLELRREEKLILREMAQERINKKHELEEKRKDFDKMLDMRLPCANIIKLRTSYYNYLLNEYDYYLMDSIPCGIILLMQEGITNIPCKFKQLTGIGAGNVYEDSYNAKSVHSVAKMYLNPLDRGKLTVSINGYRNSDIEHPFGEKTKLAKLYGPTITIRQLLLLWKTDNGKSMNIDIESDYGMVKALYNSEDILGSSKVEELKK